MPLFDLFWTITREDDEQLKRMALGRPRPSSAR
jgi:hypothetical protein